MKSDGENIDEHRAWIAEQYGEEQADWFLMTPQQRWAETDILWDYYLSMGGSLDPEPDPQSPFYDPQQERPLAADGRPGLHLIRRSGI